MRLRPFEYHAASSLDDALDWLESYGLEAQVLAGGTDLLPAMKNGKLRPKAVLSLHRLAEMNFVRQQPGEIRIGALTSHQTLANNAVIREMLPVLCQAVSLIGSWQIRNVATIGGNLCQASPAADSAGPLLALNATVVLVDRQGERQVPLNSFFLGPGQTVLRPGQLLREIIVPEPTPGSMGVYLKLMRRQAVDLALVGVAIQAQPAPDGHRFQKVTIGLGGVAPTPIRAGEAEALLSGLPLDQVHSKLTTVARAAVAATAPIDDVRASAAYRRTMVKVFIKRGLQQIVAGLASGGGRS